MIEQSYEHGAVYLSLVLNDMLVSQPVTISDIKFGPYRTIEVLPYGDFVYVKDIVTETVYLYLDNYLQAKGNDISMPAQGYFYYYGEALYPDTHTKEDVAYCYYTQNRPPVTHTGNPGESFFELPRTLQDIGYDTEFTYPEELIDLLKDVPATYVDRFKRPVYMSGGRTFPVAIDKVQTTVKDLKVKNYPIVINLADTNFAMVDLEPGYTEDDLEHFETLDGYYIESTPRGGKHLLVYLEDPVFKYRYSEHLEIINNGMITIYGLDAKMISQSPNELDISQYKSTKRNVSVPVKKVDDDIQQYVDLIEEQSETVASSAKMHARQRYKQDTDTSHGEYVALFLLYMQDIYPYIKSLPFDSLPWILEAYARDVIPWRDKHESQRNGVPYLVYLANEVIQYNIRKDNKVENL